MFNLKTTKKNQSHYTLNFIADHMHLANSLSQEEPQADLSADQDEEPGLLNSQVLEAPGLEELLHQCKISVQFLQISSR